MTAQKGQWSAQSHTWSLEMEFGECRRKQHMPDIPEWASGSIPSAVHRARFTGPPGDQIPSSPQLYTVIMSARPRPPRVAPQAQPLLRASHLQYEGHSHPRPEPGPLSNTPSSQDHPPAQLLHKDCLPWSPSPVPHREDRRQSARSQRQGLTGNHY